MKVPLDRLALVLYWCFEVYIWTFLCFIMVQGKNYKHLRMLRAAGPLTAVVSGTIFVKIYHPQSISVVSFTLVWVLFVSVPAFVKTFLFRIHFIQLLILCLMLQVGPIPQGLPAFSVNYDFASASKLFPTAALICGVAILVRGTLPYSFSYLPGPMLRDHTSLILL